MRELSNEQDARLAALVTSYGVETRSYNRSAEKREVDRQRAAATAAHQSAPRSVIVLPLVCFCWSYPFAHPPSRHGTLKHAADWTRWQDRYRFNAKYNCWEEKKNSANSPNSGLEFWEGE